MINEWEYSQKSKTQDQLFNAFRNSQLSSILKAENAPPPPNLIYNSTTDFLQDFGKLATINGSITYIVQQVPIIGTLLLVGGLGYSTLTLFKRKSANNNTKLNMLGKMVIGTGSAITGSLSGAFFGQTLIPVPILGAFIGGVVGGVIGSASSMYILDEFDKETEWPVSIKNSFNWIFNQNIDLLWCIVKGEIIVKNIIEQC
ncbi:hypothetical protein IMG5_194440 [Ichthyophthirius multifiliis]|uniref:Transmembrane protein n=1 Tax=Ichthyophthirius multifiliis TaxID=5932 RepID=G0R4R6_ICHMU|nr:hypothetical protein IMG5_194440 [Ichthyophthirius multifiliis]EGR27536.1 hypothetical protein IMG5_194440 [Ichthyophthirius multifiliis]|eukprot:XP_004024988.1 hypothetical protein IMG5_194440 [Ichthyophthirius multifiliis]